MGWLLYIAAVLAISGLVGWHLGRFQEAYTEMLGMMAGMTMGMLNGFILGYAAAALTYSMFWGNVIGILLGLTLGIYFGRPGGLMGILDGGMGGGMGGSMGAMLAIMVQFPAWALSATAALLMLLYLLGMGGLVVLIERSAPGHAALHRVAPWFTRAMAEEVAEVQARAAATGNGGLMNYYELLDIPVRATAAEIAQAYLVYIAEADAEERDFATTALATLSNPTARARYDRELAVAAGRGECCPPPRRSRAPAPAGAAARPQTTEPKS